VGWFGVPGVFLLPAVMCFLAAVGLLILAVSRQRTSNAPAETSVESAECGSPQR